jgi:hypothetical protein
MIEFRLADRLKAHAGVAAFVGTRVHPVRVPRVAMVPRSGSQLSYRRIKAIRSQYLDVSSRHPSAVFELAAWDQNYDRVVELADAVRDCLNGLGNTTLGSIRVDTVQLLDEQDDFFQPEDASEDGWFVRVLEYAIRYQESLPTLG